MEMRIRSNRVGGWGGRKNIFQKQIRINSAQPEGIAIMNSAANLTISSQPQTVMTFSFFQERLSIRLIYTGPKSSSDYITNMY